MRKWVKRAGYLLAILLWLILISFPVVAFLLATQDQIQIGDAQSGIRLFMLQESDSQGLGLQWTRPYDNNSQESALSGECTQTSLRYFLWEGDGQSQNSDYCQCYDSQTEQLLPVNACSLP